MKNFFTEENLTSAKKFTVKEYMTPFEPEDQDRNVHNAKYIDEKWGINPGHELAGGLTEPSY
uniref:Uncharacterized protein n=1 Tax=viral metagenome TaxID=1070528 RepID=A0A6M3KCQ9_9ZZZZ